MHHMNFKLHYNYLFISLPLKTCNLTRQDLDCIIFVFVAPGPMSIGDLKMLSEKEMLGGEKSHTQHQIIN